MKQCVFCMYHFSFGIFPIFLAILMVEFCKEEKSMDKKVIGIMLGSIGGAAVLGTAAYLIWNCKKMRALRAMHRTNAILHRVGNVLCKVAASDDACM